jgi:hypothetical protein
MKRLKLPPKDFGLNIRRHPNVVIESAVKELRSRQGLDVVSKSKRKAAQEITLKLSLGDRNMETVRFLNDKESAIHNENLVQSFFNSLEKNSECEKYSPSAFPNLNIDIKDRFRILGFLDAPNNIVKNFIVNFKLPIQKLSDTSAKLPLRFLLEFIEKPENENMKWDISLVSGEDTEEVNILDKKYRKVIRKLEFCKDGRGIKLPKNQLCIPQHEYRFLTKEYIDMRDRSIARRERQEQTGKPLLLLFPIKPENALGEQIDLSIFNSVNLWGWSLSMPGNRNDEDHVSVLANSVFIKELMEEYKGEFEDEDN